MSTKPNKGDTTEKIRNKEIVKFMKKNVSYYASAVPIILRPDKPASRTAPLRLLPDAGACDTGAADTGPPQARAPDTGPPLDAGASDAGPPDAGPP